MYIERATQADVTDELVTAFARLIPQLNASAPLPDRSAIAAVVASPHTHLLLARDPLVIGSLTLALYPTLTGVQGQITNVVVDAAARGRGVGEALAREALRIARAAGAGRVALTSRNTREAAHRLYQRVGFELLPSHAYAMKL